LWETWEQNLKRKKKNRPSWSFEKKYVSTGQKRESYKGAQTPRKTPHGTKHREGGGEIGTLKLGGEKGLREKTAWDERKHQAAAVCRRLNGRKEKGAKTRRIETFSAEQKGGLYIGSCGFDRGNHPFSLA